MRLFLCCAVLCTVAFLGAYGYPTEVSEDVPRKVGNRPQQSGSRPNQLLSKPTPQLTESLQTGQSANSFIAEQLANAEAAEASADGPELLTMVQVSAEAPELLTAAQSEPAHDPILETASHFPAPETVVQDAIPEIETPAEAPAPAIEVSSAPVPPVELQHLQVDQPSAFETVSIAVDETPQVESAPQEAMNAAEVKFSNSKSRRHAGVEAPSALRIGDFEDVETETGLSAPEYPATHEQMEAIPEMSKEEIILMAMEQGHHNIRPTLNSNARPAASRPNLLNSKPHHQFGGFSEEDEANESTVDLREGYEPATIVQEPVVPVKQKHEPSSKPSSSSSDSSSSSNHPYGSRNKPRPYGMDKPSKNRPTLDSGMKDKNEHFGLPHSSSSDYVQKGEMGLPSISTTSYLGFPIPTIKWTSFTDLFPNLWGNRNRYYEMGKSDQEDKKTEACVDDEEDGVRSSTIQSGALCQSGSVQNNCNSACKDKGFASGTCMGPYPTPGCMCKRPGAGASTSSTKHIGILYTPLDAKSPVNVPDPTRDQDLQFSDSPVCKKCACNDACQKSGSYTGMCADRCYCGVPYFHKEV